MNSKIKNLLGVAILAVLITGCSQTPSEIKSSDLVSSGNQTLETCQLGSTRNPHRFGDIILSGQPAEEDLKLASELGFKTVISLRHEDEFQDWNEAAVAEGQGMKFINLPFKEPGELTDAVFDAARRQLNSAQRPILIHCSSANRVGAVWIPYRVLDSGISLQAAIEEAKAIGLRTSDYQLKAENYIKRNQQ